MKLSFNIEPPYLRYCHDRTPERSKQNILVALAWLGVTSLFISQGNAQAQLPQVLAAGDFHTCGLSTAGGVKCWGSNGKGQLGDGTTTPPPTIRLTPIDVLGLGSNISMISGGGQHTCALTNTGNVKCWGYNGGGQLGNGTTIDSSTPVDVIGLAGPVVAISAGSLHTCAIVLGGQVQCWGLDDSDQLGDGGAHFPEGSSTPVDVSGLSSGAIAIASGLDHTCALMITGGVKCWGDDGVLLGYGSTAGSSVPVDVSDIANVVAVAARIDHTCVLTVDGAVYCWGYNAEGGLGDGTTTDRLIPVNVSGLTSGVSAITGESGGVHTCVLMLAGGAKCWGPNFFSQLGDGTFVESTIPVDVSGLTSDAYAVTTGAYFACALTTARKVECWGVNDGYGPTPVEVPWPQPTMNGIGRTLGACKGGRTEHANCTTVTGADPVNTASGSYYHAEADLRLPGVGPALIVTRTYNSADTLTGPFGKGWTASYQDALTVNGDGSILFRADDGQQLTFQPAGGGAYTAEPGVFSKLTAAGGGYELLRNDQMRYSFDADGRLVSETDRNGNSLTFARAGAALTSITDTAGRVVSVSSDDNGHILSLMLPDARSVHYLYTNNLLTAVANLSGAVTQYQYDGSGRLAAIIDANGHTQVANVYGSDGRVTDQFDALGAHTRFAWEPSSQTSTMTDSRGGVWRNIYRDNVLQESIDALGNTTTYTYDTAFDVTVLTDARGNATTMTYDGQGNVLTRSAPPPLSYVEAATYDVHNNVLDKTNGRGATASHIYDGSDNLVVTTLPDGAPIAYAYDAHGQRTSLTDALNHTTRYSYDGSGNLIRVTSPLGRVDTMTYDGTARRLTSADPLGNTTTYTYDAMDRLLTQTDPNDHRTTYTYDPVGNLLSKTNATGAVTTWIYDAANQPVSMTLPDNGTTTFEYDPSGHLTATTDALAEKSTYTYDAAGRRATMVTARGNVPDGDSAAFRWTYTYDANGNVVGMSDPLGKSTTSTYDFLNRLATVVDPLERKTTYIYDAAGNRTSVVDNLGETTSTVFDLRNRVTGVTDPTGHTTSFSYDAASNRTEAVSPLNETTRFAYNGDNRLVSMVDPRGNAPGGNPNDFETTYVYDVAGRLSEVTDPLGNTTSYTYDDAGNRISKTDANGHQTTYAYDPATRLASVGGPDGALTSYIYDSVGNLIARTDPNNHTTTYGFDLAHRLTDTTSPLGRKWMRGYDAEGHLTLAIDPRGQAPLPASNGTTQYAYDADGRHTGIDYSDATPDVAYTLDAAGEAIQMNDDQGQVGFETYTLDGIGRVSLVSRDGRSIAYAYDNASRVTARAYPTKGKPTFAETIAFDDDGRLSSVQMNGKAVAAIGYDPAGHLASRTFGNGVVENRAYDRAGRISEITYTDKKQKPVGQFRYTYDAVGNALTVTTLTAHESYTYDAADRLTKVCYTAACTEPGSFVEYSYDGVGNRLRETDSGGPTSFEYDADDELTRTTAPGKMDTLYTYDPAGNEIGAGKTTFTFDLANRLLTSRAGSKRWTFGYDGNGRRLTTARTGASVPTARFLWDTNNPIPLLALESRKNGSEVRRYVYGMGALGYGRGTALNYYHLDRLGSVRALTTSSGRLLGSFDYEPFGAARRRIKAALAKNPLRFAGEYLDSATTGFYYLRARQYDSTTGRFLGRDPRAGIRSETAANVYAYAANRPTELVDPMGLRPEGVTSFGCPSGMHLREVPQSTTDWAATTGAVRPTGCVPIELPDGNEAWVWQALGETLTWGSPLWWASNGPQDSSRGHEILNDPHYHSIWKVIYETDLVVEDVSCGLVTAESGPISIAVCGGLQYSLKGEYTVRAALDEAINQMATYYIGKLKVDGALGSIVNERKVAMNTTVTKSGLRLLLSNGGRDALIDVSWDKVQQFIEDNGLPDGDGASTPTCRAGTHSVTPTAEPGPPACVAG